MRAPIRPIRGRWPASLERRAQRFVWSDPRVILDGAASPEEFRTAMSAVHVGGTIKITGADRHAAADALLIEHLDLTGMAILDIGASDGSTSVDLIGKISGFSSYTMADLFFHIKAARSGNRVLFYDQAGECILIAGRRAVAWPSLSKAVRRVYAPVIRSAAHNSEREDVLLLNPTARALVAMDDRVSYAVHDVFTPWTGPRPDVVKVANLLRRLYFRDEMIETGLRAILDSLDDGGHLLIVDNPRIPGGGTRGGLYRREAGRFVIVAQTDDPPEIVDLIVSVETAGRIASSSPEICS